jgi:hypothetical protein
MHLSCNESYVVIIHWLQQLRVILRGVLELGNEDRGPATTSRTLGRKLSGGWNVTNTSERKCCRCLGCHNKTYETAPV